MGLEARLKRALPAKAQRAIRRALIRLRQVAFRHRVVKRNIFGHPLNISLTDKISQAWYDATVPMLPAFQFLVDTERLEHYKLIFYLGAHHCVYPIGLMRNCSPGTRMIAVEANPIHCRTARANIKLNAESGIALVSAAVTDADGTIDFTLGHAVATGEPGVPTQRVVARSIDSLGRESGRPGLVVMDVEGHELKALQGAIETVGAMPDWCIEVHSGCGLERFGGSVREILAFFSSQTYELFMARDYGREPAARFDPEAELARGRFHLLALARPITGGRFQE